jgi:hypothetical protein
MLYSKKRSHFRVSTTNIVRDVPEHRAGNGQTQLVGVIVGQASAERGMSPVPWPVTKLIKRENDLTNAF